MANAWANPLFKPKFPKINIVSYSRENDITFSLGRPTNYDEVLDLLCQAGCVDPSTLLKLVR